MIDPAPPSPPSGLNRVLGPTAGPNDGNVRAILAVLGLAFANLFVGALLAATWAGVGSMADLLKVMGGAVITADLVAMPFYFGKRSGETQ